MRIPVRDARGIEVRVGYCDPCFHHLGRTTTRRLTAALASALLAAAAAGGLPIALPWWPLGAILGLSALMGLIPWVALLISLRTQEGHAAPGDAVFFRAAGELVCLKESWGRALSERLSVPCEALQRPRRPPSWRRAAWLLVPIGGVLGAWFYGFQHPMLRVVNLTPEPVEVYVDGRFLGRVSPSGGESPQAGLEISVPAGTRTLLSRGLEGAIVAQSEVRVLAGHDHLYAPASPSTCFWLETVGYGRGEHAPQYEPLEGIDRFWALPDTVRGWFLPSPPAVASARATGGASTVLRQAACSEVPYSPDGTQNR